jgi:RNA polymerase sigma-70 factor (ECF subfamily)
LIRDAAEGQTDAREEFARRYESVIRAYLGARWRQTPLLDEIDDAAQETFLACFKKDGALVRVDPDRAGSFRAYLYGVVRNVARRAEEKRAHAEQQPDSGLDLGELESREEPLSSVFDRAWAKAILRQALRLQSNRARGRGDDAVRRVELLRLRFREGLPIREIAALWGEDATRLHREFARARREFRAALRLVVKDHSPAEHADLDAECARLAGLLR